MVRYSENSAHSPNRIKQPPSLSWRLWFLNPFSGRRLETFHIGLHCFKCICFLQIHRDKEMRRQNCISPLTPPPSPNTWFTRCLFPKEMKGSSCGSLGLLGGVTVMAEVKEQAAFLSRAVRNIAFPVNRHISFIRRTCCPRRCVYITEALRSLWKRNRGAILFEESQSPQISSECQETYLRYMAGQTPDTLKWSKSWLTKSLRQTEQVELTFMTRETSRNCTQTKLCSFAHTSFASFVLNSWPHIWKWGECQI